MTTASHGYRPPRNDRALDRQAERTAIGWQWQDSVGTMFSLEWHRNRRVWIARVAVIGSRLAVTEGPTVAAATATWPLLPRATFRRTLRPLGVS